LLLAIVALCLLLAAVLYRRMVAQARILLREQEVQRLEQQGRLVKLTHFGQLAQELAHEIKQPLTAINAHLYALQKSLPSSSGPNKDIAVIDLEINRLDRIVRDFLELARPAEPTPVPVQARQTLDEVRDLMASQFDQDSIAFKCECEQNLQFMADPQQLKQVLINLVKNAAECLGPHGTVTMRARRATHPSNGEPGQVAIIEVEDTGPGIPPEIKEKIFDPFFSTKEDGTGLGLAIAARIIDKHGGRLEFDSQPGKGTVFRIALPACNNGQPA
jgi:signal transduction histidine kinase